MIRVNYIVDTDLAPTTTYSLCCDGCDQLDSFPVFAARSAADVVVKARGLGWMRIDTGHGMRTYCPECATLVRNQHGGARYGFLR